MSNRIKRGTARGTGRTPRSPPHGVLPALNSTNTVRGGREPPAERPARPRPGGR